MRWSRAEPDRGVVPPCLAGLTLPGEMGSQPIANLRDERAGFEPREPAIPFIGIASRAKRR